jgi:segregation and condensation protein A
LVDYRVNLEIFAGPLDLLLYLVRKEEVDIYDIPIARITDQYIHYIEMLKSLDIDLASEFLVMAATLMEIKSAMLLPSAEPDQLQEQDLADPRAELIRQLLEYKRFKDAANLLEAAADEHGQRFCRPDNVIERLRPDAEPELDIEQVSIWDLLEAFDSICKATGAIIDTRLIKDDTPIDLYQIEILHRLQTEGPMPFKRIFESKPSRVAMIGLFLALLELIRAKLVWAEQPESDYSIEPAPPQAAAKGGSADIYLRPLTDKSPQEAVQEAILVAAEPPPIPIAELPPKSRQLVSSDVQESEKLESAGQQTGGETAG